MALWRSLRPAGGERWQRDAGQHETLHENIENMGDCQTSLREAMVWFEEDGMITRTFPRRDIEWRASPVLAGMGTVAFSRA